VPLLDHYDVYEQLLSYWDETMHDDVFLVMTSGWADAAKPRHALVDKEKKLNETPDLQIGTGKGAFKYKMDLISPAVIARHYFADELATLDELSAAAETAAQAVEEYVEENAVEEGLLSAACDDDDKVTKASAKARLKVAKKEADSAAEVAALECVSSLFDAEFAAKKAAKNAQATLDVEVLKKYGLDDAAACSLVLDEKWEATLTSRIVSELELRGMALVARLTELANRYAATIADLDDSLSAIQDRVDEHLAAMGLAK
jgi:type I restriction enzyme M protein